MSEEKAQKKPKCTMIAVLVVLLLLLLGYLVMRDAKAPAQITGGKWTAKGGCGCLPPK